MSHTRIGYALSLICMFLIWLATLSLSVPHRASLSYLICMSHIWLVILSKPHYHARARQFLCKKLYCICTHWLFVQTYAWWPAVVSTTLQRHMWLPTYVYDMCVWVYMFSMCFLCFWEALLFLFVLFNSDLLVLCYRIIFNYYPLDGCLFLMWKKNGSVWRWEGRWEATGGKHRKRKL